MSQAQAVVIVAAELRLFLRPGRRSGPVAVAVDGTSSLGHIVQSLGVPRTEAGRLLVNGEPAAPGYRPGNGLLSPVAKAAVAPVLRPGTRRTYQTFSCCCSCGQVYWHGAHSKRLEQIIDSAVRAVSTGASK